MEQERKGELISYPVSELRRDRCAPPRAACFTEGNLSEGSNIERFGRMFIIIIAFRHDVWMFTLTVTDFFKVMWPHLREKFKTTSEHLNATGALCLIDQQLSPFSAGGGESGL